MKFLIAVLLLCFTEMAVCQTKTDILTNSICDCIVKSNSSVDSIKIKSCFFKVLADTIAYLNNDSTMIEFLTKIQYRLFRLCPAFVDISERHNPPKGDWIHLNSPVPTQLNNNICQDLTTNTNFFYLESNGDTTRLIIKDNIWMDLTSNGKYYSRLYFRWIDNCEFELEFLESNDPVKSKFSEKGERYSYKIIDKGDNYYVLTVSYNSFVYQYKLYF